MLTEAKLPTLDFKTLMRQDLILNADRDHIKHPQYRGHFDDYVLCRVKFNFKTKAGLAFTQNEYAICHPKIDFPFHPGRGAVARYYTVYSARNRVDTSVPETHVEIL